MDYGQFKTEYIQAFKNTFKYTPDQVGWNISIDKMVELSDAYPIWAERAENDPSL